MTIETKNALITAAHLTMEDHGCLTVFITLDYGNSGCQGFGGYALALLSKTNPHWSIRSVAGHFIIRTMEIAGVSSWDKLVGKTIRVKAEHSKVHAIGHIVKDDWFNPSEDFKDLR